MPDSSGPLDIATLEVIANRAQPHPLVDDWSFQPDALSPRRLELHLDHRQYPPAADAARLDARWFDGGDYTFHYLETRGKTVWECRWDRHPKPGGPRAHVHPPPDAAADVEPSGIDQTHHLGVCFRILDWIAERVEHRYGG